MISSFRVENFKCFDRFEFSELGQVTVLGGRNNVGKSSLLEAMFLFHDRFNPQMAIRHMAWRGVSQYASSNESLFAPLFHRYNTASPLRLEARQDGDVLAVEINAVPDSRMKRIRLRPADLPTRQEFRVQRPVRTAEESTMDTVLKIQVLRNAQEINVGKLSLGRGEIELVFDHPPEKAPVAVFLGARMYGRPTQEAERFGELDIRGEAELVVEFLRVVDTSIKSLSSVAMEEGAIIHADVGLGRKIPVNFLGDGVNRLLSIVLAMAYARDGCVLIDEIDSGLHHSVLPNVWRWIAQAAERFRCQVIATTHNYGCLEAARVGLSDRLFQDDFAYFRLEEDQGQVVAKRYSYRLLDAAIQEGWEVR